MSTKPKVFPISRSPVDNGYFVSSPKLAEYLWIRDRKSIAPNLTWYAAAYTIEDPDTVEIRVHAMRDNCRGGIGDVIYTYQPKLDQRSRDRVAEVIQDRQMMLAEIELERREEQARALRVKEIRAEMFGGLT